MPAENFVLDLIEGLLKDSELGLKEENIRFYDKGVVPGVDDAALDAHIRWKNARHFNEDSNAILSSILMVELSTARGRTEYISYPMDALSQTYQTSGLDGAISAVTTALKEYLVNVDKNAGILDLMQNYEAIKDRLILRPLNYDNNEKVLKTAICRRVGDIALVLYVSLEGFKDGGANNVLSTMVKRELFLLWGQENEEEVLELALRNTMRLQPPVFCATAFPQMKAQHIPFMGLEMVKINFDSPMAPVLSTTQEINGAIAAFYPGVLKRIYQIIGEDFYLVFTSIYDIHIHPVSGKVKVRTMRDSLFGMNRDINSREELLSRKLYRYHGKNGNLTVV